MPPSQPSTPSPLRKLIMPPSPPRSRDASVVLRREVFRVKSEVGSPPPHVKREPSVPVTPNKNRIMASPRTPFSGTRKRAPSNSPSPRRSVSKAPFLASLRRLSRSATHTSADPAIDDDDPFRAYSRAGSEESLASRATTHFAFPEHPETHQRRPRAVRQGDALRDGIANSTRSPSATVSLPPALDGAMKQAKDVLGGWTPKEREIIDDDDLVLLESTEQLLTEVLFDQAQLTGAAFQVILDRSDIKVRPAQLSLLSTFLALKVNSALSATLSDFSSLPPGCTRSKDRAVRAGVWWDVVRGGLRLESAGMKACMTRKTVDSIIRALYLLWVGESGHQSHQALKNRFGNISYSQYLDAAGVVKDLCGEVVAESWA